MSVISGFLGRTGAGGIVNGQLTGELHEFEVDYWPAHDAAVSVLPATALTTHWPVSTTPRALSGKLARAFSDDWYHRIHIRPAVLNLGNVVSTQVTEVRLWNAYLVPQALGSVDVPDVGMSVTGMALPATLGALQETVWLVSVTLDGPSVLDAVVQWQFAAVPSPPLSVIGNRIIAWVFAPDWTEGVLERLTWSTDILSSDTAAEQRRALRIAPRRGFEAQAYAEGRERALLDLALSAWGSNVWALPIWPDVQWLEAEVAVGAGSIACRTAGFDFHAGGLAMLRGETAFDVETVEVLAVAGAAITLKRPTLAAWPVGTRLYPVRLARFAQEPSLRRLTDRLVSIDVSFELAEPADWPAVLPVASYRGAPVFDLRPNEAQDLTVGWQRLLRVLDNGSSLPSVTDSAGTGFAVQQHSWLLHGRTEHSAWRSLMYALRGRQGVVWLPTHADDLRLVATASGAALDVEYVGYSNFAVGRVGRRDIGIELANGSWLYRRITGAVQLDATKERLSIDTPLASPITVSDVRRICYLQLCRQDTDVVELQHDTDADGVAQAQTVWRTLRDELELAA